MANFEVFLGKGKASMEISDCTAFDIANSLLSWSLRADKDVIAVLQAVVELDVYASQKGFDETTTPEDVTSEELEEMLEIVVKYFGRIVK